MTRSRGARSDLRCHLHCVWLDAVPPLAPLADAMWAASRPLAWLDSSAGSPERGRLSVLCETGPTAFATGRSCRQRDRDAYAPRRLRAAFQRGLARHMPPVASELAGRDRPPFCGGWIGYLAYEAMIDLDPAFPGREALLPYPRIWFAEANFGITVDHEAQRAAIWEWIPEGRKPERLQRWLPRVRAVCSDHNADTPTRSPPRRPVAFPFRLPDSPLSGRWYRGSVEEIIARIREGEVYQVNLTVPVPVAVGAHPFALYARLRSASPGDYSALLSWPGLTVLSSSPEQLFALRGRHLTARPMKGTRPRSADAVLDAQLADALGDSAKDRAENLMIVDLVRHDLGRIARIGSVRVSRLFEIERYATVHQMTSTVEAELDEGLDVFDVFAALFPPGSMTGAPKIQSTRVIGQLEPRPRGLYSGSLGFIDWSGEAVFNVVIRTLVSHPGGADWAVGGGVVADSEPAAELAEAESKLEALRRALAVRD